eukprot:403342493
MDTFFQKLEKRDILNKPLNQLFQGYLQGAFRFQMRKGSTCLNEGVTLGIAAVSMGWKSMRSGSSNYDDSENFNDVVQLFMRKCNYQDSVQMSFINNYLINRMEDSGIKLMQSPVFILKVIDWGSLLGDVVESAMSLQGFFFHFDLFNLGILLGKMSKVTTQLWMKGMVPF